MNAATLHTHPEASSSLRARAASVRNWIVSTRCAVLACAALWIAYGTRVGVDAGPFHLFETIFFTGAVALAVGIAWFVPFVGAMLFAGASIASWIFLDATPVNAGMAAPAFAVSCLLLHRWKVETSAATA